jgi:ADP-heptose:LPS heptosyltransferase
MYRNGQQVLTHDEHRFILSHAALGDMITSLPALIHARTNTAPLMRMVVHVPPWQIDLVKHLLAPYGEFEVRSLTEVPHSRKERAKEWGDVSNSRNTPVLNTHTRNRVHMVDFAFNFLIDARPENMAQRSYPVLAPLGVDRLVPGVRRYVVFPVGATSDNKLFRASVYAPVMKWCLENSYLVVIVGTKMSNTHAELGDGRVEPIVIREQTDMLPPEIMREIIDLREKTTLLELRDVLGHAAAVVGVDGGTLHLAGTTDVPIIFASGTTLPKHRYIARRGDPNHKIRYIGPRDLECAGCQSNWIMTRLDFRDCVYGDNKCMEQLHPDDFIAGLKELGL